MIAGALLLLTGLLTENRSEPSTGRPTAAEPAAREPEVERSAAVFVREASGERRALPQSLFREQSLVLALPPTWAGDQVEVTLYRRSAGRREATAWLTAHPRIDFAGHLSMAGIVAGRYDVEVRGSRGVLTAEAVLSPGRVSLPPSAPAR